ncbi:hypothetical protein CVS40_10495, partial [Lucilia cuprina]
NFLITAGDFCAVRDVYKAIAALSGDFIKFNQPHAATVDVFFRISKFPKVVGTIDSCTNSITGRRLWGNISEPQKDIFPLMSRLYIWSQDGLAQAMIV